MDWHGLIKPAIVTVAGILIAAYGWVDAPRAADRVLRRLIRRGATAPSDQLARRIRDRLRRRNRATMLGMLAGVLVGAAVLVIAAEFDHAITWLAALDITGAGVGAAIVHVVDNGRAAAEPGPRAAVLRPRRLRDFLLPGEIAAPYLVLALPLIAAAFAATGGSGLVTRPGGWLVPAVGAAVIAVVATLAQRLVLHTAPPAESAERVRWEDVMRAVALRDIGIVAYSLSLILGIAAVASAASGSAGGAPWPLQPVTVIVSLLSVAGLVALAVLAERFAPPVRLADRLYGDTEARR